MPANPRWYPNELPALTQSTSSSSALETAVRSLQNDARTQSIRQALSRRSAGIIAAAEQNRGAIVIGSLMPLTIDPVIRSQPATQTVSAVGTVGYVFGMGGGNIADVSADRVTFATDAVATLAGRTSFGRKQRGSASRLISGFLAGGSSTADGQSGQGEIEEFLYSTETSTTLSATLPFFNTSFVVPFSGRRAPSGFSSTSHAFFIESWTASSNQICRVSFESKSTILLPLGLSPVFHHGAASSTASRSFIFSSLGVGWGAGGVYQFQFSTESSAYVQPPSLDTTGESRQVLGNGVNTWVFGGRAANPTWNYRFVPQTNSYTRISADLSAPVVNAARVGSSAVGYLCGGTTGPYHYFNSWFTTSGLQIVTKFTFATEAITAAPNALSTTRSHGVGISNFAGAFV